MRVALAGNPNSGKTTLFNALTGSNQYVGNWPGVTVEKKAGKLKDDPSIEITDLPGIYSLSPYTLEEVVARNFLLQEKPEAILNIVDGSNLERNLYLTTQLLEMGVPVIIAINMMDVVRKNGDEIYSDVLAKELGCTVVEISALRNEGIEEISNCLKTIASATPAKPVPFSTEAEEAVAGVIDRLPADVPENLKRFYAIKLLEKDEKIIASLPGAPNIDDIIEKLEKEADDDTESVIINDRYTHISSIIDHCRTKGNPTGMTTSDKIDRVVTNRFLALPIFVVIMFLVYYISVTTVGGIATDWANDGVFGDGWFLGPGQEQYDEAQGKLDEARSSIDAFEAAGKEAGLDPESETFVADAKAADLKTTFTSYDEDSGENSTTEVDADAYEEAQKVAEPYKGDAAIIAAYENAATERGLDPKADDFADQASKSDITASYVDENGEVQEIDYAKYKEECEGKNVDPSQFGIWVPGIPKIVENGLDSIGCADWLKSLVLDGIIAGVGAVLGFIPQMLILFLMLAFLESCGYMARVAFILDRVFRRFGLSGKSFIPILIGTGCGVPGIMSSRTIENQNDRRMTVMTTTFIPCGAKLPIIALFAGAVFGGVWWVAPSAYFLGIVAILCSGIILKKTRFFAGDPAPFVMELPPYHMPTIGAVLRSMWERAWSFIKKAGTIILVAAILIWFISNYGVTAEGLVAVDDQSDSILAVIGNAICWIWAGQGFGNWQAASATITGLIAKENVVSTFGILYDGDAGWYANVQAAFTYCSAYAFLAFNLLCAPCFAAMGAIKREMNNRKWFWGAIGYQCGIAWVVSLWIYQFAGLACGEVTFNAFTVVALVLFAAFLWLLFRPNKWQGKAAVRAVDEAE